MAGPAMVLGSDHEPEHGHDADGADDAGHGPAGFRGAIVIG